MNQNTLSPPIHPFGSLFSSWLVIVFLLLLLLLSYYLFFRKEKLKSKESKRIPKKLYDDHICNLYNDRQKMTSQQRSIHAYSAFIYFVEEQENVILSSKRYSCVVAYAHRYNVEVVIRRIYTAIYTGDEILLADVKKLEADLFQRKKSLSTLSSNL